MYLLLDSNVTAGYYLPRSLDSVNARKRIEIILDSKRTGESDYFIYIPNFCIAEVFSVFMKHSFGAWNQHLKGKKTINTKCYAGLVKQFQKDIHNGKFLYHLELNRYHILGINLVTPIDHYYKISKSKKRRVIPASTMDHLIISMGINLSHIHGSENVCIVSADDRLTNILSKCKSKISQKTIKKLKLEIALEVTGKPFRPDLFPKHLNLKNATTKELAEIFGKWPLTVGKVPKGVYRWTR